MLGPSSEQQPNGSLGGGREGAYGGRKEILLGPMEEDLHLFARHCKNFYFSLNPSEESSRFIPTTLASLPPTHRSAYTRIQSTLRAHAHLHHLRLRVSSFHALLSSLASSGSLTPSSRLDIGSSAAKHERRRRLEAFASNWCSAGTEPFFKGLWAVLRLQSRARGGAAGKRVVWEVDDAVFQESGEPEFQNEAVTILKGILGFEDQALSSPPHLRRVRTLPRRRDEPDPFNDEILEPDAELDSDDIASEEVELNKPRLRLWVFPAHINNQEVVSLMRELPKQRDVRFGRTDSEAGAWEEVKVAGEVARLPVSEAGVAKEGTGRIWIGQSDRKSGWEGGIWFRFIRWCGSLFT